MTVCNLNFLTSDGLNRSGILSLASDVLNTEPKYLRNGSRCTAHVNSHPFSSSITMEDIIVNASHSQGDFIANCTFKGIPCEEDYFEPFGLCYNPSRGKNAGLICQGSTISRGSTATRHQPVPWIASSLK